MTRPRQADLAKLIARLVAADVEFIVVGGAAAVLHGAPTTTIDLDIVHARTERNVDKLLVALEELGAIYRDPAGRELQPTRLALMGSGQLNLATNLGLLVPLCVLHDGRGYDDLLAHVVAMHDGNLRIQVLYEITMKSIASDLSDP